MVTGLAWAQEPLGIVQACQLALAQNLQLAQQRQQVDYSRGARLISQAPFDPSLSAQLQAQHRLSPLTDDVRQATGLDQLSSRSVVSDLNVSTLLRSGVRITPSLQFSRSTDSQSQPVAVNNAQLRVEFVVPLARHRGGHGLALREQAAWLDEQASLHELQHWVAQTVTGAATAYWQYVGALQTLKAYQDAEERAADMLGSVQALASVDIVPRVQVQDARSNVAARAVLRIGQERTVAQARLQLAQALGLDESRLGTALQPLDPLPDAVMLPDPNTHPAWVEQGLAQRADLRAAQRRLEQQLALRDAAQGQLKPQMDLVVGVGYAGARRGQGVDAYLSALGRATVGPSLSVGLQYQFPHRNLEAEGAWLQMQAQVQQQETRVTDTRRQIVASVLLGLQGLDAVQRQLVMATEGVQAAQAGHEGARERLRQGIGSVMDSLQAEDRHITAVVSRISAQVALATAITALRQATGSFVHPDAPQQALQRHMFYQALTVAERQP